MSLEAVQRVTEAQQEARRRRAEGAEQAKRISADAETHFPFTFTRPSEIARAAFVREEKPLSARYLSNRIIAPCRAHNA